MSPPEFAIVIAGAGAGDAVVPASHCSMGAATAAALRSARE
jgi:hypothetical protein